MRKYELTDEIKEIGGRIADDVGEEVMRWWLQEGQED